jgi:ribosomal protein S18 acetylase RimI-like enzyme
MIQQVDIQLIDITQDLYEILRLEIGHEYPWNGNEFAKVLKDGGWANSFVARDSKDRLIGYIIAQPESKQLCLLNIMVEQECRLNGVGRSLIRHLIQRGRKRRKASIIAQVRERNLDAQVFLRKCGFFWIKTLHNYYDDISEDCFLLKRVII